MNILVGSYSGMVLGAFLFVVYNSLGQNPLAFMTGFVSASVLSTVFFAWLAFRGYISVVMSCSNIFERNFNIQSIFTFIQAFNGIIERGLQPEPPRPRIVRVHRRARVPDPDQRQEEVVNPQASGIPEEIEIPQHVVEQPDGDAVGLELNEEGSMEEINVPDATFGDEEN